jgi:hypothetical protein
MDGDLARSGLVAADLDAVASANPFGTGSLYRIPYYLPDGSPHPLMYRQRLEFPASGGKYDQPAAAANPNAAIGDLTYPYFNPRILQRGPTLGMTWAQLAATPAPGGDGRLFSLVEGEKKTVAVGKFCGALAIGIGGCWNGVINRNGVYHLHPALAAVIQPGDRVQIIFDADIHTNREVERAAGSLRRAFIRHGVRVAFVLVPRSVKGIDDWLMTIPMANRVAEFDALPRVAYDRGELIEDHESLYQFLGIPSNDGKIVPNESAALAVFNHHERYRTRVWVEDSINAMMESVGGDKPKEVTEAFVLKQLTWFQTHINQAFKHSAVSGAFKALPNSDTRHRNAIHEYINKQVWDKTLRLETMFIVGWGAEDSLYTRSIGLAWMVGVVARAFRPGCDMQTMLVLEGAQGIGKSRSLRALGEPWYVETTTAMEGKDFLLGAHRSLILDLAELGAYKYADFAFAKALISTAVDSIRAPYGTHTEERPRRFVCVATTNEDHYLRDMTGNRRFWPIACGKIDVDWVRANRGQLFAEAKTMLDTGAQWWVDDVITAPVQNQRLAIDPWEDALDSALSAVVASPPLVIGGVPYHFVATSTLLESMRVLNGAANTGHYLRLSAIIKKSKPGWSSYIYRNTNAPLNIGGVMKDTVRGYRSELQSKPVLAAPTASVTSIAPPAPFIPPAPKLAPPPGGNPFAASDKV